MQEAAFRALGIKAFYLPFEVRPGEFRRLMAKTKRLLLDGFNVTVPYKERVLRYLDRLSPEARSIGAVNTVVRDAKGWQGFNTDEAGFLDSLVAEGRFRPRGKTVLVLGAGGSARAVAYGLARQGARRIILANRTLTKARRIVSRYQKLFPRVQWESRTLKEKWCDTGTISLVVNATSVGLRSDDPALISPREFPRRTLFVDLIYQPSETRLLRLARRSGHRTLNGMGMLLCQGARAFQLWTGRKAPVAVMRKTLQSEVS